MTRPDFALTELQLYQAEILARTRLKPEAFNAYTFSLFERLIVVPNFLISTHSYLSAFELCKEVDEKDTPYVALALEFGFTLLTKDDALISGLQRKERKEFSNTLSLTAFMETPDSA